jgi:3-hydroxyacyl-CoA dehydrogenase
VASAKDIDVSLKLIYNFPKGLLEMADEYGLDLVVKVLKDEMERVKAERLRRLLQTASVALETGRRGKGWKEGWRRVLYK